MLPGVTNRFHAVVFILPPVDAASERVLSEVVPVYRTESPLPTVHDVVMVVDVVVDNVPFLVRGRRRTFGPLSGFPFGTDRSDFPDKFPNGLT